MQRALDKYLWKVGVEQELTGKTQDLVPFFFPRCRKRLGVGLEKCLFERGKQIVDLVQSLLKLGVAG